MKYLGKNANIMLHVSPAFREHLYPRKASRGRNLSKREASSKDKLDESRPQTGYLGTWRIVYHLY